MHHQHLETQHMTFFSSRRAQRATAALAGVALSALALTACATGGGSSSETPAEGGDEGFGDLTLQLSWILNEEFAGEYFADSEGYYEEAGFSSVNLVTGPETGVAPLLSGSADIALSDSVSIGAAVANESAPLKIIGATFQENPFTILSRSEEHTSELQSLMRTSYAVFCVKKKKTNKIKHGTIRKKSKQTRQRHIKTVE